MDYKVRTEGQLIKIGSDLGDAIIVELKTKKALSRVDIWLCSLEKLAEQQSIHGEFSEREKNIILKEANKKINFLDFLLG
jgi:hypothetical protein